MYPMKNQAHQSDFTTRAKKRRICKRLRKKTTLGKYHNGRKMGFVATKPHDVQKQSRRFDLVNRTNGIFTVELKLNKIPNIWHASHTHSHHTPRNVHSRTKNLENRSTKQQYPRLSGSKEHCHISHFD